MGKSIALLKKRIVGFSVLAIAYIFVSLLTFYAVRLALPIVTYYGRTSLYLLPAVFTYLMPLVVFYIILMSMYAKSIKGRLRFVKTLGFILLAISLFNLITISLCIGLLFDGKVIVNYVTPIFPLDVLIINILYLFASICCLLYQRIDRKYVLSVGVSTHALPTFKMVFCGIFLAFSTYFFGEFIFGFIFLQEGYVDPNWPLMIPHYLSFILPSVIFAFYIVYMFIADPNLKLKFGYISLLINYGLTLIVFIWLFLGMILQPYLIAQSLQWEYEIGLAIKLPMGMFFTILACAVPLIVASVRMTKRSNIFKVRKYEQEQKTLQ